MAVDAAVNIEVAIAPVPVEKVKVPVRVVVVDAVVERLVVSGVTADDGPLLDHVRGALGEPVAICVELRVVTSQL